jgi:hypothetical protein
MVKDDEDLNENGKINKKRVTNSKLVPQKIYSIKLLKFRLSVFFMTKI